MDLLSLTKTLKTQAAVSRNENSALGFHLSVNGQVEHGELRGEDQIYVKYDFTYGQHWDIVQGVDKGISQIGAKSEGTDGSVVWSFPIDILFRSLNAHGWPRLVVSVFGMDSLGRDVAKGYGSVLIPTRPGAYTRVVRLFRPVCSSYLQQLVAWLRGQQPEFFDSRFVARSDGRETTRVESVGSVTVKINVVSRGMAAQGYESGLKLPRGQQLPTAHQAQQAQRGQAASVEHQAQSGGSGGASSALGGGASSALGGAGGRLPLQNK